MSNRYENQEEQDIPSDFICQDLEDMKEVIRAASSFLSMAYTHISALDAAINRIKALEIRMISESVGEAKRPPPPPPDDDAIENLGINLGLMKQDFYDFVKRIFNK